MRKTLLKSLIIPSLISSLCAMDVTYDTSSSLMWQDNGTVNRSTFSYEQAQKFCENLVIGEYKDFRLPSIYELQTLIDYRYHNPAMLKGFKNPASDEFWTSTPYAYRQGDYWTVDFKTGTTEPAGDRYDKNVRCVQPIQ